MAVPTVLEDAAAGTAMREDPLGLVGHTLVGRFHIERFVAEGGFGVVYRAHQIALGRTVALKILKTPADLLGDERAAFQQVFETEARTIARLKHPNIVEVYDFAVTPSSPSDRLHWMALEWLEGETLEALLERERGQRRSPAQVMELMRPVLKAIGFAHRQHVVHRDLKPANVFVVEAHGQVVPKVLDFGIAKMVKADASGAQRRTTEMGAFSPDYAAPEQLARARTGPATDVHALGLMLTELLTGERPYGPDNEVALEKVMSAARPTPATWGIEVGHWETVLATAMNINPSERYPDADALLHALEHEKGAVPFRARLVRNPAVIAALAVCVAGGGYGAWKLFRRPGPMARTEAALASLPADDAVADLYREGLNHLRRSDARGARGVLEQVTARAPQFAPGHVALASAWAGLGRRADQQREAALAWQQAPAAGEQRLFVEASWRASRREWAQTVEVTSALFELFPRSFEDGLRLASAQLDAGRARDVVATVARLRGLPGGDDPRASIIESLALDQLGDHAGAARAAGQAKTRAQTLAAPALVGEALMVESYSILQGGDRTRAAALADEAYEVFLKSGNSFGIAQARRKQGAVAWKTGELAKARAAYEEAIATYREIGDDEDLGRAYNSLAGVHDNLGRRDEAMRLYRLALPLFEKTGDRGGLASVHLNLGQQLRNLNQPAEAEVEMQRALLLAKEGGFAHTEGICLESLAHLYLDRGELDRSLPTARQAIALAERIGDVTTVAQVGSVLARGLLLEGQVVKAEAEFEKTIRLLEQLHERARTADANVELALLLFATGRLGDAKLAAAQAIDLHQRVGVATGYGQAVLARILLAMHRLAPAQAAVSQSFRHGGGVTAETAAAEIEVVMHRPKLAIARIERVLLDGAPDVAERFEIELVLAHAEHAAGQVPAARSRLRDLVTQARTKGFALLATRAVAAGERLARR